MNFPTHRFIGLKTLNVKIKPSFVRKFAWFINYFRSKPKSYSYKTDYNALNMLKNLYVRNKINL